MGLQLISEEIHVEIIPLLGKFLNDRFSNAIRLTHLPTKTVVYSSPFDFPEPKTMEELKAAALCSLEFKVERLREKCHEPCHV